MTGIRSGVAIVALFALAHTCPAWAQKKYGPGVTDTEIKIGQTAPYSGNVSALGAMGKAGSAYFDMINDQGGINGRKIKLISLDDGYSPPKTVEQTRKLVEQEEVLALFNIIGTAQNMAVLRYTNANKVPHICLASGNPVFVDPENYPWTMACQPSFNTEAQAVVKYLRETRPNAKIAILYQNDDTGKAYRAGFRAALGDRAAQAIVAEASYEPTDPTVDSQVIALKGSGADVFLNVTTPKFGAQAIRKAAELDWKPLQFLAPPAASVAATLQPAGVDKSVGIITAFFVKDPTDVQWQNDKGYLDWLAWMKKYNSSGSVADVFNVYGYNFAQIMTQILKQAGDDLTRENVMRQATNLKDVEVSMLLPGIKANTSPKNYQPVRQTQLYQFNGKTWIPFTQLISPD